MQFSVISCLSMHLYLISMGFSKAALLNSGLFSLLYRQCDVLCVFFDFRKSFNSAPHKQIVVSDWFPTNYSLIVM